MYGGGQLTITYNQGLQEVMVCDEECQMMTGCQGWQEVRVFCVRTQVPTKPQGCSVMKQNDVCVQEMIFDQSWKNESLCDEDQQSLVVSDED